MPDWVSPGEVNSGRIVYINPEHDFWRRVPGLRGWAFKNVRCQFRTQYVYDGWNAVECISPRVEPCKYINIHHIHLDKDALDAFSKNPYVQVLKSAADMDALYG